MNKCIFCGERTIIKTDPITYKCGTTITFEERKGKYYPDYERGVDCHFKRVSFFKITMLMAGYDLYCFKVFPAIQLVWRPKATHWSKIGSFSIELVWGRWGVGILYDKKLGKK